MIPNVWDHTKCLLPIVTQLERSDLREWHDVAGKLLEILQDEATTFHAQYEEAAARIFDPSMAEFPMQEFHMHIGEGKLAPAEQVSMGCISCFAGR